MPLIALTFILVFVGGLLAALVVEGVWAFVVYQIVYFMHPSDRWWGSVVPDVSYSFFSVGIMAAAVLLQRTRTSQLPSAIAQPVTKWMIALLLTYVLLFMFAIDGPAHQQATIELAKLFVVMLLAYKLINDERTLKITTWAYILGCTYIGYVAYGTGRNQGARLEGIGTVDAPDSNGIAAAVAPALVLLIYYAWMGNKYIRAGAVVCAALIVNAIVLINSRGAFVGIAAGASIFVLYMLFSKHQRPNQRVFAVLVVLSGLVGSYALTDEAFWERMATLQEYEDGTASGSHRVEFWVATFDMVEDHPMGLGVRGYNKISRFYLDPAKYGDANKSVHSAWFQILSEVGWLGLFMFVGMLVSISRVTNRTKARLITEKRFDEYYLLLALQCALVTFLVAATFINRGRAEVLYWLILFLACASNVYYLQYASNRQNLARVKKQGAGTAALGPQVQ